MKNTEINLDLNVNVANEKRLDHSFYLVDNSPWPFLASLAIFVLTNGFVMYFHESDPSLSFLGVLSVIYVMTYWFRDMIEESTVEGHYTSYVRKNLYLGIALFIVSEIMFFISLFWAYLHSALSPHTFIGNVWPPAGVVPTIWFLSDLNWFLPTVEFTNGITVNDLGTLPFSTENLINQNLVFQIWEHLSTIITEINDNSNEIIDSNIINLNKEPYLISERAPRMKQSDFWMGGLNLTGGNNYRFSPLEPTKNEKILFHYSQLLTQEFFELALVQSVTKELTIIDRLKEYDNHSALIGIFSILRAVNEDLCENLCCSILNPILQSTKWCYLQEQIHSKVTTALMHNYMRECFRCQIVNIPSFEIPILNTTESKPFTTTAFLLPFVSKAVSSFNWAHFPLANTFLLVTSGVYVTLSLDYLKNYQYRYSFGVLAFSLIFAFLFTVVQYQEYRHLIFGMNDSVFGSSFYLTTGFHGIHVIVGSIWLIVCLIRLYFGHFTKKIHVGFEGGAWYWHFVDIVWIFVFFIIYVWSQPAMRLPGDINL